MKDLVEHTDVETRFKEWLKGHRPFLYIAGRVFTLVSAGFQGSTVRVFLHCDDGRQYLVDDFIIGTGTYREGGMMEFIKNSTLDGNDPEVQKLTAFIVTKRITEAGQ